MATPPPWTPGGGGPTGRVPATPFRFWAARSVPVLDPNTYQEIGGLDRANEYYGVEVSGAWVLAEDGSGHRGWVPFMVTRPPVTAGKVLALLVIVLAILWSWAISAFFAGMLVIQWGEEQPRPGWAAVLLILGDAVLLGGMWCAWRVGTGHWDLRRRPTEPAPPAPPEPPPAPAQ